MSEVLKFPSPTYRAKSFTSPFENEEFQLSGTLDGFIDLAVPNGGTYPLSVEEAKLLVAALSGAIADVQANCLYERDALLVGGK